MGGAVAGGTWPQPTGRSQPDNGWPGESHGQKEVMLWRRTTCAVQVGHHLHTNIP